MNLILFGINHKTAPLKVRERFSFTGKRLKEVLIELKSIDSILGVVILSTCNRTEIYAHMADGSEQKAKSREQVTKFFLDGHTFTKDEMNRYFYVLEDIDAVKHVFRVAGGLDSQVLGETQILGQVKSAWTAASEIGTVSSLLDGLFRKAVDVGKIVRTETKISRGNVSLGSAAIKMIEERFFDLMDKFVLIIGAGKIGTLISKYLKEKGINGIFVSNRTYMKARELAENCGGKVVNFSRLQEELKVVDIVICSTSSPHLILRKETLAEVMEIREKPLLIIDLALPRDVAPEAKEIQGISLYDLDDLKSVVEENYNKRKEEAKLADAIVQRKLDKFHLR